MQLSLQQIKQQWRNLKTERAQRRGWRRALFTWLWVGDNPYVATSEGEIGDLLHLPPAEGRQPHSIKLEVFALKLNRRARRVCLALGHRPNEPPAQWEGKRATPRRTVWASEIKEKKTDEGWVMMVMRLVWDTAAARFGMARRRLAVDAARRADGLTYSQSCRR